MAKIKFNIFHEKNYPSTEGFSLSDIARVRDRHTNGIWKNPSFSIQDTFTRRKFVIKRTNDAGTYLTTYKGNFQLKPGGGSRYGRLFGKIKNIKHSFTSDNKTSTIQISKIPKQLQDVDKFTLDESFFSGDDTIIYKNKLISKPGNSAYPNSIISGFSSGEGDDIFKIYGQGEFHANPGEGRDTIISYTRKNISPYIKLNNGARLDTKKMEYPDCEDNIKLILKGVKSYSIVPGSFPYTPYVRNDQNATVLFVSNCQISESMVD